MNNMYDVITFGSASRDILIKSTKFISTKGDIFPTGKGFCLPVGSKIEVENIIFSVGGGGTNTAAVFAKLGFSTAYCGMVGDDLAGKNIILELKKFGINSDFICFNKKTGTNHSIIISNKNLDRTILVWRGSSDLLSKKDIPWQKIKNSRWFYIAPLSGQAAKLTEDLIDFAYKNKIKIALNPGYNQLKLSPKITQKILKKVDILILNQEEASLLTGISYIKENEIFKKLDELVDGIAIMTKGDLGATASDGKYIYKIPALKSAVVDKTGAGDSFGAGFVANLLNSKNNIKDIEKALQFAIANSASCLTKFGAKQGLLSKGQKFKKVKVSKQACLN
jgi:sugar/nucleoside kinase (ribokinase family)